MPLYPTHSFDCITYLSKSTAFQMSGHPAQTFPPYTERTTPIPPITETAPASPAFSRRKIDGKPSWNTASYRPPKSFHNMYELPLHSPVSS